ncbi:hypothetical protein [Algibacter sp. 2305UL17-15]|uniref:hypothetical protein n=1 Tax=Algibacter sp. 2305UL17-15 TaxID=3231268 RepID=UPI00345A177B
MKKIKISLFLLIIITSFSSCEKNELNETPSNSFNYADLDSKLKVHSNSIKDLFSSDETIENTFNKSFKTKSKNNISSKGLSSKNLEETYAQVYIELPSQLGRETNNLLLEYYNDMINAYDYEIPDLVNEYQNKLDSNFLMSSNEKQEFQIILNASKYAIQALEEVYLSNEIQNNSTSAKGGGFWDCMRKTAGKKIGRGMVYGAVTGAVNGGIIGATGGTVAFPGVGTATGAVGGAVFGGAAGAVKGAVGGVIWAAADCLSYVKAVKFVEIEKIVLVLDEDDISFDASIFELPDDQTIELLLNK